MQKKNYHFNVVEKAFKKHNDWINVLKSFGCNEVVAEDICQEMYIQLQQDVEKGLNITFDDDVNYYYIYKILRGMYLNLHKVESRIKKIPLDYVDQSKMTEIVGVNEQEYQMMQDKLNNELSEMYWYDKKVFTIVATGTSISKLSRESKISYYSLYNTYRNVKQYLKDKLCD